MVDAGGRAWLISINSRPGYAMTATGGTPERLSWISDSIILRGVAEFVLGA